jgi:hypothetical protein
VGGRRREVKVGWRDEAGGRSRRIGHGKRDDALSGLSKRR